jgi:hypothetical protein
LGILGCFIGSEVLFPKLANLLRIVLGVGLGVGTFVVLFTVVFPDAALTMNERQVTAVEEEGSTIARVGFMATEFLGAMETTPALGFGVGAGTNAGSYILLGERGFAYAEYEWTRLIQELGPFLGVVAIAARVGGTVMLLMSSVRAARRGNGVPLVLFGFVGPTLCLGQFTTQNTILGFTWFTLGMLLASVQGSRRSGAMSVS